jgi:hypothetical protein
MRPHREPIDLLGADRGPVVEWRGRLLLRAGFPPDLAARVAADSRSDVSGLLELVERGCPPATAVRILAPDDPPPHRSDP